MELFKLRAKNLGRIADAELSIRPLTVFYGPNNTNKTWMAYSLYGLAQLLAGQSSSSTESVIDQIELDPSLKAAIHSETSRFSALVEAAGDTSGVIHEVSRSSLLKNATSPVSIQLKASGLSKLLAIPEEGVARATVRLDIDETRFSPHLEDRLSIKLEKGVSKILRFSGTSDLGRYGGDFLVGELNLDSLSKQFVEPLIRDLAFRCVRKAIAFPSERKALVTLYNHISRDLSDSANIPVRNFLGLFPLFVGFADVGTGGGPFPDVVRLLEEKILGGSIDVLSKGPVKYPAFTCASGSPLRLHTASSLVRALAGFDLYLNGSASAGDLIVIDEPEMNAHPEAQLMIAELLGVLVNKGINVVITTHSPYIVDHINNLVEAAELPEARQGEIESRFRLGTRDAFVPADKVATYHFSTDGHVTDTFNRDDRIIDWTTFGKTSDFVTNLYGDILERQRSE